MTTDDGCNSVAIARPLVRSAKKEAKETQHNMERSVKKGRSTNTMIETVATSKDCHTQRRQNGNNASRLYVTTDTKKKGER